MGRGPDKSLGVVLVFEAKELIWVYFVILLGMSSPSSSKSFSLSQGLLRHNQGNLKNYKDTMLTCYKVFPVQLCILVN